MLVSTRQLGLLSSNRLVSFVHVFQPFAHLFVRCLGARKIFQRKEIFLLLFHRTDPHFLFVTRRGMKRTTWELADHPACNKHPRASRCLQSPHHIVARAGYHGCRTKFKKSRDMFHVLYHLLDFFFLAKTLSFWWKSCVYYFVIPLFVYIYFIATQLEIVSTESL